MGFWRWLGGKMWGVRWVFLKLHWFKSLSTQYAILSTPYLILNTPHFGTLRPF